MYIYIYSLHLLLLKCIGVNPVSPGGSGGTFSATLGYFTPGCALSRYFNDPICSVSYDTQFSHGLPFPLSVQALTSNLEGLSSIQKVKINIFKYLYILQNSIQFYFT
jgi:hypothetical protein